MKWPTRDILLLYLGLGLLLDLLFVLVYGGSNWLNSTRQDHFALYASWELRIPMLPAMVYVYLSISLFFLLPLFSLKRDRMLLLAKRMAAAIVIAGLLFNLIPTVSGFERDVALEQAHPLFKLLYLLDRPHNLFPSLHVALSTILLAMVLPTASASWRLLLTAWWLLLCFSVLFVHQHHLLDIAGGLLLAAAICRPYSRGGT